METAISAFCQALAAFCHHVDTASKSLSDSIQRRPIPLDSAASAFLQSLDRRISCAGADLELLESMAFGTVSFEELLGHCNEVFKNHQRCIVDLEDRMQSFGYVPGVELDDEVDEEIGDDPKFASPANGHLKLPVAFGSVSVARSSRKRLEEDSLFEDSISLQNLGLSDACLATLASEEGIPGGFTFEYSVICNFSFFLHALHYKKLHLHSILAGDGCLSITGNFSGGTMSSYDGIMSEKVIAAGFQEPDLNASDAFHDESSVARNAGKAMIKVTKDDYDGLPAFMKSLVSWEELQEAIVKINSFLSGKDRKKQSDAFNQDDLEIMGLGRYRGRKGRSYLLPLLRMNQLVAETNEGSMYYRVPAGCC
ncbi:hypothetical protein MUK42_21483 [Musa troglodytarum]|uniref:Spindle and kinetochore-associated protein 3 n=1 Tax=Musa troglodytarum TaxID=320322 RepID=A0A9E7K2T1_9LILI|nr:hypothetical protein MUK42_21483 [Musa troglodytarum]